MFSGRLKKTLSGRVSILIDPGNQSRARHITLPKWLLSTLSLLAVLLILGVGFYSLSSFNLSGRIRRLERKNQTIAQKIGTLWQTADSISACLTYIECHDIQLRIRKGMQVLPADVRQLGVGGPTTEPEELAGLRKTKSPYYSEVSRISQNVDALLRKAHYQVESFAEVETRLAKDTEMWDHIPSIVPTTGRFSGRFGYRKDPILGIRKMHCGVDISNKIGTPVIAPADGVVCFTGKLTGYGIVMKIDHGYGITTVYAHLSRIYVEPGQEVSRYDLIAAIGNTGRTVGPHLHYEVRIAGKAVNPEGYLLDADEAFKGQPPETWPRLLPQR